MGKAQQARDEFTGEDGLSGKRLLQVAAALVLSPLAQQAWDSIPAELATIHTPEENAHLKLMFAQASDKDLQSILDLNQSLGFALGHKSALGEDFGDPDSIDWSEFDNLPGAEQD